MAKSKKKHDKRSPHRIAGSPPESGNGELLPSVAGEGGGDASSTVNVPEDEGKAVGNGVVECPPSEETPEKPAPVVPPSRLRRALPDLIKVAFAFAVIGVAAVIWYKPPLIKSDFPYLTYSFGGEWLADATLYRPLAVPTRYYVSLPRKLAGRYEWFAVDRRREVAALAEEPKRRLMGRMAIKRGEPLGLDLEFRKIDGSEWQVFFFDDFIVFSNAVLAVRLDVNKGKGSGK